MRPAQIAASAACTQAEGSFRVEVFVSAFGRRRFCGRVHLQTHSRRTEKRCCFVLAAAAGRASRQERCKTLEEKARGEAFSAAFRYLDGCRAAFVRHAGLYAKDCGRAFLFGERLHVIPAAFAPRTSGRDLCSMPADLLFGARCTVSRAGSVRPARRTLRKRLRRAFLFGERLHIIPAAFVPRDGAPRRLSHAERLRRLTRRVGSLTRSVCAAGVRPRFVFDAS